MSTPMRLSALLLAMLAMLASAGVHADSSCTATNDNQDQQCATSCPSGQTARCANGSGSSAPKCECESN
ncbi:MAG: hypothetical protein EKK65_01995 [Lysobacterales bacterium]|nr:MAG: hypothetical protein EKK65_01995 [Xanthomonadales bacterium]